MLTSAHLHIELTNRCTLACPACPRTTWKDILKVPVKKSDLDIDTFAQFIDCEEGEKIERFVLCGDYGDCIYYPQLFEFIQRFRHKKFDISTNGSYQTLAFWTKLAELLTEGDTITFGIDGWDQASNEQYRINSEWNSMMLGIDIMSKSKATVLWQTIIFSFNFDKLDKIKQLAESKGAKFFAIKSMRFGNNELMPPNDLVEIQHIYVDEFDKAGTIIIEPQCETERVVTSDGYFLPCDWIRNPKTFYKSDLWQNKQEWLTNLAIDKINLTQGLVFVTKWKELVIEKGLLGSPKLDVICKMNCRKGCNT